ncbi:MAG: hypothetical protein AAGH42_01400 [Pseudomonadota bacterium]
MFETTRVDITADSGAADTTAPEDASGEGGAGTAPFQGQTGAEEGGVSLNLFVEDAQIADILRKKAPGRGRDQYALAALKIGVIALQQAGSNIDAANVRREGDRLLESLGTALSGHRESLVADVARALGDYFDPKSGALTQRVEKLVQEGGDIERVIRAQIGGDGSVLAQTLQAQNSPLLALLDPFSEKGLAANLAKSVDSAVATQKEAILREFSLDNPAGALSRTLRELAEKHHATGASLEEQIKAAVAEFSLDKSDSALSNLVRRVEQSQRQITDEFSLDKDGSALARMRRELTAQITELSKAQQGFQTDMVAQLREMAARKAESLRSTTHGLDFEDALAAQLRAMVQGRGDLVTATGNATGRIRNCKKGDMVIELGPDHAVAGARIVVEAKQNKALDMAAARAEIEEARKNRDAGVGVFVYSARSAPAGLGRLSRVGQDVFLIWDADDAGSDLVLDAGLSLATALLVQGAAQLADQSADFATIEKALLAVEKQVGYLDEFEKWAGTIDSATAKMRERTRKMRDALLREMAVLNESVSAVKQAVSPE